MISIIIPTKDEEGAIEKTLRNLAEGLKETPYELIVSDSHSKDRTVEIAKKYAHVVEQVEPERKTIAWGRNMGAKTAKGEYLVFIDADVTVPEPDKFFARCLNEFQREPKLVGLTANLRVLKEEETCGDYTFFGLGNLFHWFSNNVLRHGSASGEFQMIPREVFWKLNGFRADLAVAEDADMFQRLAKLGRTKLLRELTVYHTGRRGHVVGWPKLLMSWWKNWFMVTFRKRSADSEWKEIR